MYSLVISVKVILSSRATGKRPELIPTGNVGINWADYNKFSRNLVYSCRYEVILTSSDLLS